jgi:hypothetical protein
MLKKVNFNVVSFIMNIIYGTYNILVGFIVDSWWFKTAGVYYLLLTIMRLFLLKTKEEKVRVFGKPLIGSLLMMLSLPLAGMVILDSINGRGIVFHEIVMITIALFTFTKLTLASINFAKAKSDKSVKLNIFKNISFADAFVSIVSLQRSMLVSFEGMKENEIRIMNIVTGSAVCVIVFLLGLNLIVKMNKKKPRT